MFVFRVKSFGVILGALLCLSIFSAGSAHAAHRHHRTWSEHHRESIGANRSNPFAFLGSPFGFRQSPALRQRTVWEISPSFDIGAQVYVTAGRRGVAALVRAKAEALGVPVNLALAVAHFESGFRMGMRGGAGEKGAMQVLPQTARHLGVYGNLYGSAGIEAGVRYLREALAVQGRYGLCAALSAYNHGLGRVRCTGYGRTVLALAHGERSLRAAAWEAHWEPPHHHRHHHFSV